MNFSPECKVSGSLSFILHISRVMGVAPLNFKRARNGWRIKASKAFNYYGKILAFILVSLSIAPLAVQTEPEDFAAGDQTLTNATTNQFVWLYDILVLCLTTLAVACTGFNRMRVLVDCVEQLKQINKNLSQLIEIAHSDDRNNKLIVTFSLLLTCVTLTVDYLTFMLVMITKMDVIRSGLYIFYIISSLCLMLYVIQFNQVVFCVLPSLQQLNNCLKNLLQILHNNTTDVFITTSYSNFMSPKKKIRKNILNQLKHKSDLHAMDSVASIEYLGLLHEKTRATTIHKLGGLYCSLADITRMLNDSNGLPLAVLFMSILLQLVVQFYHLFAVIILAAQYSSSFSLLPFFWVTYHLCRLLLIVEPCHRIYVEGNETKNLINEMKLYTPWTDIATISELKTFYQHVMLNEIIYAPLQLFKITRTLVVTMLSSIATYLIIIVQL